LPCPRRGRLESAGSSSCVLLVAELSCRRLLLRGMRFAHVLMGRMLGCPDYVQRLPAATERRADHVAVERGDELERDALRADRLALAVVGAGAEDLAAHGGDHVEGPLVAFGLALRE